MPARLTRPLAAAAALVALAVAAPRAAADTINLTLTNGGTPVTYNPHGGSATTVNGGPFNWTQKAPINTGYASSVTTYCIDLDQTVSTGSTYTFTAQTDLKLAPTVGTAAKGAAVNELFGRYYADSLQSGTNAAAFQLALWELVYDGATSKSLTAGRVQGSNALAKSWLGQVGSGSAYSNDIAGSHLVALVSGHAQDQIMVVKDTPPAGAVPAPPGVVLAGMGLGCFALGRLRRRPAANA